MSRLRLTALLLALTTLLVFLPAGGFSFVNYDDNDYLTDNPVVKHGLTLAGVRWAFTGFHVGNWHPLTWLSHMADCTLFGLNAGAHHVVNVLFHAANAALVFVLLWRLTGQFGPAVLVAALFAWHPLHVESVAWVSERKDVLSTGLGLLALLSYEKFARSAARKYYWLTLLGLALGLLAKPMLVTLPFILLLLDYWPLHRLTGFTAKRVVEKIPFFLIAAVGCAVTYLAQKDGAAIVSLAKVPLGLRFENAPVAVTGYLQKFFWPTDLCVLYPMPASIPLLTVVLSVAVLGLITAAAWRGRESRPYFLTGWLWFLGTLVPVIGIVQVGDQAMADRYTYFPSIGLFIALVFLANDFFARRETPGVIRYGLAGVVAAGCILATENQLEYWHDGVALFQRAVAVTQNNATALIDLGVALDAQGRLEEALPVYHQAEALAPDRYQVHNNLGNVLGLLGRHAEALTEDQMALRQQPQNPRIHKATGSELAALGRFDEALGEFAEAVRLDSGYVAARVEAGQALFKIGRAEDGLDQFRAALRLEPENFKTLATVAHYLAADENAGIRDGKNALLFALKADELSGHGQPKVLDILGMALAENGDFTNAIACTQQAATLAAAAGLDDRAMKQRLALYQNHQPWRESFRADNPPAGR